MIALHTAIAIIAIIALIIRFKVDPIIALVLGCLYLGLASGVGLEETVTAITTGFGDIMAKIGLLIGFGVLMGALLHAMGAFKTMVEALVRVKGLPPHVAEKLAGCRTDEALATLERYAADGFRAKKPPLGPGAWGQLLAYRKGQER